MGNLSPAIAEFTRRQLIINEMTVEAVLTGDIKLVYQLFTLDPMIRNLSNVKKMADEISKMVDERL